MTRPVVDVMTGLDEEIGRLADIVTGPYTSTRESLRHRPHAVDNDAESMAQVKGHVNRPPADDQGTAAGPPGYRLEVGVAL